MLSAMFDTSQGLQFDGWTWTLALLLTVLWMASICLTTRARRAGWSAVPMSLFGFTWVGFGIAYVSRFWVLSVDSVTYGDLSGRLMMMSAEIVNDTLIMTVVFWVAICAAYWLGVRLPGVKPLRPLVRLAHMRTGHLTDAFSLFACAAVAIEGLVEAMPAFLLRPVGLVGSLWIIPATVAWMGRGPGHRRAGLGAARRWLYLIPGILSFFLAPYRERLLTLFLVPFLTALFAGRRFRLVSALALVLAFGVASTAAVGWYRMVVWQGYTTQEASVSVDLYEWIRDPYLSPWGSLLRRFHSFDSLLLSVYLIPDVIPFEDRNLVVDAMFEGFVPRALYPEKPESARARYFSTTIWHYGLPVVSEANIAPSMVGDLYSAGDVRWVALGAVLWGLLLGLLERWKDQLAPQTQVVMVCYLGLLVSGGLERDFARAVATVVQNMFVLYAVALVLADAILARRPGALKRWAVPLTVE